MFVFPIFAVFQKVGLEAEIGLRYGPVDGDFDKREITPRSSSNLQHLRESFLSLNTIEKNVLFFFVNHELTDKAHESHKVKRFWFRAMSKNYWQKVQRIKYMVHGREVALLFHHLFLMHLTFYLCIIDP